MTAETKAQVREALKAARGTLDSIGGYSSIVSRCDAALALNDDLMPRPDALEAAIEHVRAKEMFTLDGAIAEAIRVYQSAELKEAEAMSAYWKRAYEESASCWSQSLERMRHDFNDCNAERARWRARAEAAEEDAAMWQERALEATRQPSDGAIYASVSQRYERDDILQVLFETANALESRITEAEKATRDQAPYEHPILTLERARAILARPHMHPASQQ